MVIIFIDAMFLGSISAGLLSLKQESNVCIVYHNNYFTSTLLNSDNNSARAKVAEKWQEPEREGKGEGEGRFLGQTIWMGRY